MDGYTPFLYTTHNLMRNLFFLLFIGLATIVKAQDDMVILRDGREMMVKIIQIGDKQVIYKLSDKKKASEQYLNSKEVYMIRFKEDRNVYFNADGSRFTGERYEIDKNADILYLVSGKEIPVYQLNMTSNVIRYKERDKKKAPTYRFEKSDVFMIKYKDGTKDIITAFPEIEQKIKTQTESSSNSGGMAFTPSTLPVTYSAENQQTPMNEQVQSVGTSITNKKNVLYDIKRLPKVPFNAVIQTNDGWNIKAVVKRVDVKKITYAKATQPNGNTYTIEVINIKNIKF